VRTVTSASCIRALQLQMLFETLVMWNG